MLRSGLGIACVLLVSACGKSDSIAGDGSVGALPTGASGTAGTAGADGLAGKGTAGSTSGSSGTSAAAAGATGSGAGGSPTGGSSGAGNVSGAEEPGGTGGSSAVGGSSGGGAISGAGGSAGMTESGGSSGMSEVAGGAGASCTPPDDPSGCACFSDADCEAFARCYSADCRTDTLGTCRAPPQTGCFGDADCPAGETCVGGHPAPCGTTLQDAVGTCEGSCTLDGPACPTGYGCACQSPNNPNLPPDCVCHKECGSAADCSGNDSLCGCGGTIAEGLCVSNCFCLCG